MNGIIQDVEQLPLPNPDELPDKDNRLEQIIFHLQIAADGNLEGANPRDSEFFENLLKAAKKLDFYIKHPKSSDEYKKKVQQIQREIVELSSTVTKVKLEKVEKDINKYPNKYKSLLKNSLSNYKKGESFQEKNNYEQAIHFYKKSWEDGNFITTARSEIFDKDQDGVDDYIEDKLGLDSKVLDYDNDGLPDGYELYVSFTDPKLADSDNDGVKDGDEDRDGDGLTNKQELKYGTNPWLADSDADGLDDKFEVEEFKSDPSLIDTDEDGLTDKSEYILGTNPLNPDSNGNGVLDGFEIYEQDYKSDFSNVTLDIRAQGDISNSIHFEDVTDENIFNDEYELPSGEISEGIPGLISEPINIEVNSDFEEATVKIPFDIKQVPNGDTENLAMYYLDETLMTFVPLDKQGVNMEDGFVWGETDHFTVFAVFYKPTWETLWKSPLNTGTRNTGDVDSKFFDIMLILDSSGSMSWNDPNDYRKAASKTLVDSLIDGDRAGVIDFDDYAYVLQGLTGNIDDVKKAINRIDSSGGTDISRGVQAANNHLIQNNREKSIKIEILLTDGDGYYNHALTEQAKNNGISIYTIGLGTGINESLLRKIAEETNGQYYYVSSAEQLPETFDRIGDATVIDDAVDTDNDGIPDSVEINGFRDGLGRIHYTLPDNPDTDGDGIIDGDEGGSLRMSGVNGDYYFVSSNPNQADSDGDGIYDAEEPNNPLLGFTGKNRTILDEVKLQQQFLLGVWAGIKDSGIEALELLLHPIETGEAIWATGTLFVKYVITGDSKYLDPIIKAYSEQISEEIKRWDKGDQFDRAFQIGELTGKILVGLVGAKGIGTILKNLDYIDLPSLPDRTREILFNERGNIDLSKFNNFVNDIENLKYTESDIGEIIPQIDGLLTNQQKGVLGEAISDMVFLTDNTGFIKLESKINGNQGFDGLFVKYDSNREVEEVVIVEAKYGTSSLSTSKKGKQMSEPWIIATIDGMINNNNLQIKNVGLMLDDIRDSNPEIIYTKLIRTNKDGTIKITDNPAGWGQ